MGLGGGGGGGAVCMVVLVAGIFLIGLSSLSLSPRRILQCTILQVLSDLCG